MKAPENPIDEVHRLDALRALDLLDTDPDPKFDSITNLARALFGTEICLISIVDADRQWFKSCIGLEISETPRDISFCGHAILQDQPFIILDTFLDDRFKDNPLVIGPPFIRFYAGAPIRLPHGYTIGTVCALSCQPKDHFGESEQSQLAILADLVVQILAAHELGSQLDKERAETDRLRVAIEEADWPIALIDPDGGFECTNPAFDILFAALQESEDYELAVPADWIAPLKAGDLEEVHISIKNDNSRLHIRRDLGGYLVTGMR
jgi:GAF domain-containing protein